MKKFIIPVLLLISESLFSQVSVGASPESNNRWTFGGGIGIGFGSQSSFYLQASPRVGYRLTEDLEGGVVGSISWQTSDYNRSTMFGVGPFLNYYIARTFYLGANYQHYFINYENKYYDYKLNNEEDALYLGGGYMQRIGNNSFMQFGVMYNVLWKERTSIFSSGLVPNIGFVVGL
ncbi:hypothetical protein ODZ84_14325 [Chryseobacterium fluminis]|uniref:hypothetical protein n=1 Tax=Chryseobacterium fluminis TaxID=2983606 RepID=UPI00224DE3A4|nr:hypothetical protein [Chryseobacterium sp. MMS21-Ot14]UZT96399.1 hypothetical protein ODZ84_14325 [Chryseobacterium sp. MMS21-Ot14]